MFGKREKKINAYPVEPPLLIENNKRSNICFRIRSESVCVLAYGSFLRMSDWKEAFFAPVSFRTEQRTPSSLPSPVGSAQWQRSVLLFTDGSNIPGWFFTKLSPGNISWFGLATSHRVNPHAIPVTITNSELDPGKTSPFYFNHSFIFTLAVTPRLNFQTFFCRSNRSHEDQDCLTEPSVPEPAAAPARHQSNLLAVPGGWRLSKEQCSWGDAVTSYTLLSSWQFPTTLV